MRSRIKLPTERGLPTDGRAATARQKNSGTRAASICSTIGNKTWRDSSIGEYSAPSFINRSIPCMAV